MGGRLDAVNVVDADVAVITSIALDHCEWLGNNVEAIGREKAGIMRSGRPVIYGDRAMPNSITAVASEFGAVLYRLGTDFDWQRDGDEWKWRGLGRAFSNLPRPALHGEIQYHNASAVLATITALGDRLPVEHAAIARGLRTVRLRGRFEVVPNPRSPAQWIVDVAHNPAAAQTLATQLERARTTGRTIAVCAILGDKDVEGVVAMLKDRIDVWIVCGLASARALPASDLAARFGSAGVTVAHHADDVAGACAIAEQISHPNDRVIVFGSFLTAAAAIEYLGH